MLSPAEEEDLDFLIRIPAPMVITARKPNPIPTNIRMESEPPN